MSHILDYDFGISAVDSGFVRPWLAAVHLIVDGDRAAVVDTATNACVPRILQALAEKRISPEQVDYVILTHIHLDHAGGAGLLMSKLPNAKLCVHPRGARHMVDPSKLMAGTIAVYGEDYTRAFYGDLLPIAQERLIVADEGVHIELNGRTLSFIDTPGHARHHCCVIDDKSGHVFTGDTFGLGYRELEVDGRRSVFPTSSPVHFDPAAAHHSVDRIVALRPEAVYLTHFGQVREIERLAADMHRLIDAHVVVAESARDAGPERHVRIKASIERMVLEEGRRQGWRLTREALLDVFATDIELNAQGLGIWLDARDEARAPAG